MRPHGLQPTRLLCPWNAPGKNTGVGCHFLLQCMKVKSESEVTQSCLTLRDPMDCSPPGSSIHGVFQATVLEWGAIAFSTCYCSPLQSSPVLVNQVWEGQTVHRRKCPCDQLPASPSQHPAVSSHRALCQTPVIQIPEGCRLSVHPGHLNGCFSLPALLGNPLTPWWTC